MLPVQVAGRMTLDQTTRGISSKEAPTGPVFAGGRADMGLANHPSDEPRSGAAYFASMRSVALRIVGVGALSLCGLVCPGAHSGRANTRPHSSNSHRYVIAPR